MLLGLVRIAYTNASGCAVPGEKPDARKAPHITLGSAPRNWTNTQFINTARTGTSPQGRLMHPAFMPWSWFTQMTDDELEAS